MKSLSAGYELLLVDRQTNRQTDTLSQSDKCISTLVTNSLEWIF